MWRSINLCGESDRVSGGRGLKRFLSISESAAKLFINSVLIESLTSRHVTVVLHRFRACGSNIIKRKKYGFVRVEDLDQSQGPEDQSKTCFHSKPFQICGPRARRLGHKKAGRNERWSNRSETYDSPSVN